MTRRDYCGICNEMVGDYDVMCHTCDVSLCHDCATPYDELTYILLMNARFLVSLKPSITIYELCYYITSLKLLSDELISKFDPDLNEDNSYTNDFNETIKEMEKTFAKYLNYTDENSVIDLDDIKKLKKNFENIQWILDDNELSKFICLVCYEK